MPGRCREGSQQVANVRMEAEHDDHSHIADERSLTCVPRGALARRTSEDADDVSTLGQRRAHRRCSRTPHYRPHRRQTTASARRAGVDDRSQAGGRVHVPACALTSSTSDLVARSSRGARAHGHPAVRALSLTTSSWSCRWPQDPTGLLSQVAPASCCSRPTRMPGLRRSQGRTSRRSSTDHCRVSTTR
jgi:hypothetical protein